jgi:four helix bundle protein
MADHRNLEAWKLSIEFVSEIYKITETFPKKEMYGLTSQIRRSAVSIPSNIAEGSARQSDKELIQFLYIALGSTAELETQLLIAQNLSYLVNIENLCNKIDSVKKLILGLIKYLKNKT